MPLFTSAEEAHLNKCRILIVENDPQFRDDAVANLAAWGYDAIVATGRGRELLHNAVDQAAHFRCHLALVDMRLVDDDDAQDTSGLDLVVKLKPTESIIVSSFGDYQRAVEAIKQKRALDFVGKEQGPNKLRNVLDQAAREYCRNNLTIKWYPAYEPGEILAKLRLSDPAIPDDEPDDLLRRLYIPRDSQSMATVVQVELKPVSAHYRSSDEIAPLERSIVFVARPIGADQHPHQAEIVKIALADQIRSEINHYRDHVEHYLPPDRTARIEDTKNAFVLWDIGAIRYTNIATVDRRPLRQWYAKATARKLEAALKDLFTHTLEPWYQMDTPRSPHNVYDYYVATFAKLGPRINAYADQRDFVDAPGVPYPLRNPVSWTRQHAPQSRFVSKWAAYTHGDLHSDNIFVDQRTNATCVIDYERSGPGYVLRDFAELETDIRLRLAPFGMNDLMLAHQLDLLLLAPEHRDDALEWRDLTGGSPQALDEARKVFETISALRRLAAQSVHVESMDEYYWALLMETLISVLRQYDDWDDQVVAHLAKWRALVAASALAERLAHWGKSWPPGRLTAAELSHTDSEDAIKYDSAAVRQLLEAALTDRELTDLCQDHFPQVYNTLRMVRVLQHIESPD